MATDETLTLYDAYARFFIEDFALKVYDHLKATFPIAEDKLKEFIAFKVDSYFSASHIAGNPANTEAGGLIRECVEFVEDNNLPDPLGRATWDYVSNLPSVHHDDLQKAVFNSAILYSNTITKGLIETVFADADTTTKSIQNAIADHVKSNATCGRVNLFNWGLLSDGMWLNGALLKAYYKTRTFKPDEKVTAYYAKLCFDYALGSTDYPVISDEHYSDMEHILDIMSAGTSEALQGEYEALKSSISLVNILKSKTELNSYINLWESGLRDANLLVTCVDQMSSLVRVLSELAVIVEDDNYGDVRSRILQAVEDVTLCLCGYEAMRESEYADKIIFCSKASEQDGLVDVYVNKDVLNSFYNSNKVDADLLILGKYLAYTFPNSNPKQAWSLEWANARFNEIETDILTRESDRNDEVRRKSANIIQAIVSEKLTDIARSYLETKDIHDIPGDVEANIGRVARLAVKEVSPSIHTLIGNFLLAVVADPFITGMANTLMKHMELTDGVGHNEPIALTVLETAVQDAFDSVFEIA